MSCEEWTRGHVVLPSRSARQRIFRAVSEAAREHDNGPKLTPEGVLYFDMPVDQPGWGWITFKHEPWQDVHSISWWSEGNRQHAYVRRDPVHRALLAALNTTRWTDRSGGYMRTNDESTQELYGTLADWHTASGWGGLGREWRPRTNRDYFERYVDDLRINVRVGDRVEKLGDGSAGRFGVVRRTRFGFIYAERDDGTTMQLFKGWDAYRVVERATAGSGAKHQP